MLNSLIHHIFKSWPKLCIFKIISYWKLSSKYFINFMTQSVKQFFPYNLWPSKTQEAVLKLWTQLKTIKKLFNLYHVAAVQSLTFIKLLFSNITFSARTYVRIIFTKLCFVAFHQIGDVGIALLQWQCFSYGQFAYRNKCLGFLADIVFIRNGFIKTTGTKKWSYL